ncbi:MAG: YkgJ family cysteine cluster protein [Candidatus Diapherotrites archaeon]
MDFDCSNCGTCCKKYFIQILPEEAKKISKFMGIPEEEFISDYTQLFMQFFVGEFKAGFLLPSAFLEKKFFNSIKELKSFAPKEVMALPTLAFKRTKNACTFLMDSNKCRIYSERPLQCVLFPFISLDKNEPNFLELYPFCLGLRKASKDAKFKNNSQKHFKKTSDYFTKVKKQGFESQWKYLPKTGVAVLESTKIGSINRTEFLEILDKTK